MTATFAAHQPTSASSNWARLPSSGVRGARRNRTRIALGLVVIVLCVLATASLFSSVTNRAQVLALRREVPAGHAISANDLAVARVSVGADVLTTPASERDRVVGRVAAVTLVAGSLLAPADVSAATRVTDGMAIVGAELKAGQYPVSLSPGDKVQLAATASPSAIGNPTTPIDRGTASVLDVAQSQNTSDSLAVSFLVPKTSATTVADDAAASRLIVMVVGG